MIPPESIDIPEGWESAAQEAAQQRGAVMVIGATDVGKSTLVKYLMDYLLKTGMRLALVDCDVGQTTLGPPTTISMAMIDDAAASRGSMRPEKMRFIGSISPAGRILEAVVGAEMMVRRARQSGANVILVDTDGMIEGLAAAKLKYNQVALIEPIIVFALQRGDELEPLLISLGGILKDRLKRLPASPKAQTKTYSQRRERRKRHFLDYFSGARIIKVDLSRTALQGVPLGTGRKLLPEEADYVSESLGVRVLHAEKSGDTLFLVMHHTREGVNFSPALREIREIFGVDKIYCTPLFDFPDRLVGLCDASGDCLALGTIKGINFHAMTMELNTPLQDHELAELRIVQFGDLKVLPTGEEDWVNSPHPQPL